MDGRTVPAYLSRVSPVISVPLFVWAGVPAHAEVSTAIIPYAEIGISEFGLEFEGVVPAPPGLAPLETVAVDNKLIWDATTLKLGLAGSIGRFYVNGYVRGVSEASDTQVQQFSDGVPPLSVKWVGDRMEASATVGFNISSSFTIFLGYRDSETSVDGTAGSVYDFDHDGFFTGASYRKEITDTGSLTFAFGYAWLDAEMFQRFVTPGGTVTLDEDGDGTGVKVGLLWRDFLTENWGYTLSAEYYEYDFDLSNTQVPESGKLKVVEDEVSLQIGLFYVF